MLQILLYPVHKLFCCRVLRKDGMMGEALLLLFALLFLLQVIYCLCKVYNAHLFIYMFLFDDSVFQFPVRYEVFGAVTCS